jgi:ABC-type multidrug transport system ATPase subunit
VPVVSLLEFQAVGKRLRDGELQRTVLRDVSFGLESGEVAVVWGPRRSGRSTLLRLAAGIESPDSGVVRFDGEDLSGRGEQTLGDGIGFCHTPVARGEWRSALDHVMVSLLARGVPSRAATVRAAEALERTGGAPAAGMRVSELDAAETVRVALARVLALQPRLLVIDEPTKGVDLLQRDGILVLLRTLATDGIAVLASTGDATALSGADRALSLSEGQLRGPPSRELAPVLALRRSAGRRSRA